MPRQKITTVFTPRNKITTDYTTRGPLMNDLGYLITQLGILNTNDGDRIVFHTGNFSEAPTVYSRPRYSTYIEDMTGEFVGDLSGEQVIGISGKQVNKINTFYT